MIILQINYNTSTAGEQRQQSTTRARDALRLALVCFYFILMTTNDYITDKLQHVNNRVTMTVTTRALDALRLEPLYAFF